MTAVGLCQRPVQSCSAPAGVVLQTCDEASECQLYTCRTLKALHASSPAPLSLSAAPAGPPRPAHLSPPCTCRTLSALRVAWQPLQAWPSQQQWSTAASSTCRSGYRLPSSGGSPTTCTSSTAATGAVWARWGAPGQWCTWRHRLHDAPHVSALLLFQLRCTASPATLCISPVACCEGCAERGGAAAPRCSQPPVSGQAGICCADGHSLPVQGLLCSQHAGRADQCRPEVRHPSCFWEGFLPACEAPGALPLLLPHGLSGVSAQTTMLPPSLPQSRNARTEAEAAPAHASPLAGGPELHCPCLYRITEDVEKFSFAISELYSYTFKVNTCMIWATKLMLLLSCRDSAPSAGCRCIC